MRSAPLALVAVGLFAVAGLAQDPRPVPPQQFDKIHQMIKKQDGEWLWAELPWSIQFADAQRRAISEGKPIFVVMSAQGSAVGCL